MRLISRLSFVICAVCNKLGVDSPMKAKSGNRDSNSLKSAKVNPCSSRP